MSEPNLPLSNDKLIYKIATGEEIRRYPIPILRSRVLFCAKEAVHKAARAQGEKLSFHDMEIDLETSEAMVTGGIRVPFKIITVPRIVVLAWCSTSDHPPSS